MKIKINFLLFALIVTKVFSADAQKILPSQIPDVVKASFAKQYPGVTATWEKEGNKYEAGFKKNNQLTSALFEENGIMTESEVIIKISELPTNVLAYIKQHYKGKTIKEGSKITKADGTINFEAEVGGKDIIFDAKGKFLKVTRN